VDAGSSREMNMKGEPADTGDAKVLFNAKRVKDRK
jgi:hypothetical protein